MKKKIKLFFIMALIAALSISCSESENDFLSEDGVLTTRATADSPFLVTSPTDLYFTNVNANQSNTKTLNLKVAGVPLLTTLTHFDIVVQGPDADYFSYERPDFNLAILLTLLMSGGIDIPVTYSPETEGSHEAELLITGSLLAFSLLPVQTTVPLHGNTEQGLAPVLQYTMPVDSGTTTFDRRVSTYLGEYHLDFIFDQNIRLTSSPDIDFAETTNADILKYEIVNGNTLRVTVWENEESAALNHTLVIQPDSIITEDNVENNEPITLNYSVTGSIPD